MAYPRRQKRSPRGRGFQSAVAILGAVSALQLAAILWSVLSLPSASSTPGDASAVGFAAAAPSALRPALASTEVAGEAFGGPEEARDEAFASETGSVEAFPHEGSEFEGETVADSGEGDESLASAGKGDGHAPAMPRGGGGGSGRPPPLADGVPAPVAPRPASGGGSGEIPLDEALDFARASVIPISDPILEAFVSAGVQHRATGNTQRALAALREAEQGLPGHPRILAELAATYEMMGLADRATPFWGRLAALGQASAGAYRGIAEARLKGEPVTAAALGLETGAGEPPPILKIGEIAVEEGEAGAEGQLVVLRVVIDGDRDQAPEADQLALVVFFYDLIDEARIEASTADTLEEYPSAPYDWLDTGTEEIVVTYRQPAFTPEERRELGDRRYYGYVIELYYQDELLDKVIMPEELAAIAPASDGPVSQGALGPENALFPPGI